MYLTIPRSHGHSPFIKSLQYTPSSQKLKLHHSSLTSIFPLVLACNRVEKFTSPTPALNADSFRCIIPFRAHVHKKAPVISFRGFLFYIICVSIYYKATITFDFKLSGKSASSIEILAIILNPYVSLMESSLFNTSSAFSEPSIHEMLKNPSK